MQLSKSPTPWLIAGQGLAGTLLAFALLQRGASIQIADRHFPGASSRVAEGIINPVLLKWYTRTWRQDTFFPFAFEEFQRLEKTLQTSFFNTEPLKRIFHSKADRAQWMKKKHLLALSEPFDAPVEFNAPFGAGSIEHSGSLDTVKFLDAARSWFIKNELLVDDVIEYHDLKPGRGLTWKDGQYAGIIFCEGARAMFNPWFKQLPFAPVRGEVLEVEISQHVPEGSWNKSVFLVPSRDGFLAGASYNWTDLYTQKDEKAVLDMTLKLEQMLQIPFSVKGSRWGIRPAVEDRRPLLGRHPGKPEFIIFNGLGSKGISMAPWLAHHLADHLIFNRPLDDEINITRFLWNQTE